VNVAHQLREIAVAVANDRLVAILEETLTPHIFAVERLERSVAYNFRSWWASRTIETTGTASNRGQRVRVTCSSPEDPRARSRLFHPTSTNTSHEPRLEPTPMYGVLLVCTSWWPDTRIWH